MESQPQNTELGVSDIHTIYHLKLKKLILKVYCKFRNLNFKSSGFWKF